MGLLSHRSVECSNGRYIYTKRCVIIVAYAIKGSITNDFPGNWDTQRLNS